MRIGTLFLCTNIIKEKEHVLGINVNPRARPFYPADIRKFWKTNMNAENKIENIPNSDIKKESKKTILPETNQWNTTPKDRTIKYLTHHEVVKHNITNTCKASQETDEELGHKINIEEEKKKESTKPKINSDMNEEFCNINDVLIDALIQIA